MKKRYKELIKLLNTIKIDEYDSDAESILYILACETEEEWKALGKIGGLINFDYQNFRYDVQNHQNDFNREDDNPLMDLIFIHQYMPVPNGYNLWYQQDNGFSLERVKYEK